MATQIPATQTPILGPATITSDAHAAAEREDDSSFADARTIEDAHQVVVRSLKQIVSADAIVHLTHGADGKTPRLNRLRFALPPDRAKSLSAQLVSVCQKVSQTGQRQERRQLSPERIVIGFPIPTGRQHCDVLGLIASSPADAAIVVAKIENLVARLSVWVLENRLRAENAVAQHASATVELMVRALQSGDRRKTCQVIVTELAEHLDLRRAAIGLRPPGSSHCRLVALSDSSKIDTTTSQSRDMEDAMDEALMYGQILTAGQKDSDDGVACAAGNLARESDSVVFTIPLDSGGVNTCGAILAIVDVDTATDPIADFLSAAQPALATVLSASDNHSRARFFHRIFSKAKSKVGVTALLSCFVFAMTMFVPVPHRETCDAQLEPSLKRFVAAPFEGTLKECFVAPGDLLRKGDLLASLDGRELTWKRDALQADHHQAIKKRDSAQALRAFAEQRIAQLEVDSLRSELELLDHRLKELELRSPINGIVTSGDLQRAKGIPLTTGQTLFEIAPLSEMLIEASVLDDQIAFVKTDQTVQLRLNAHPSRNWESSIALVNPRSEIRDQENVFIAECILPNDQRLLRPGMKGTIKIDCGRRRLGWILFHRPYDSVSQWLWW